MFGKGLGVKICLLHIEYTIVFTHLQEVLELTQRKFLRHITTSIISNDLEPYPCLFVVDFISDKEKESWQKAQSEKLRRPKTAGSKLEEGESEDKDDEKGKGDGDGV